MGFRRDLMDRVINPAGHAVRDAVVRADDATQAFIRNQIYRLPTDGSALPLDAPHSGFRDAMGQVFHAARPGYGGDATMYRSGTEPGDDIGLMLSRGVPLAAFTAAGVGLAQLTHDLQNEFGGPADFQ